jgi:hypothetical protein
MSVNTLKEIFLSDLQEKFWNGLEFVQYATDHGAYLDNNIVNVPNYVGDVTVVVNPTASATLGSREDANVLYTIDHYATNPTKILLKDEFHTNYSLRESTVSAHRGQLVESIGDTILYKWAQGVTASGVFRTTGATTSAALAPGATGVRKKITKEDVRKIALAMDMDKLPKGDRYIIIPSEMYYELFDDQTLQDIDFNNKKSLPDGVINEIYGIKIIVRSIVNFYNATTLNTTSTGTAGTRHLGALAFHKAAVSYAFGNLDVYLDEKSPYYYGASSFGIGAFMGAKSLRDVVGQRGVYSLIQE